MKITPHDKRPASVLLLLAGILFLIGGCLPLSAPFIQNEYWLLIVCLPFAIFAWWIAQIFISTYLNSTFSTTEVEFENDKLTVRNSPFGKNFSLRFQSVQTC